jgi:hypothetical protein
VLQRVLVVLLLVVPLPLVLQVGQTAWISPPPLAAAAAAAAVTAASGCPPWRSCLLMW